jgi:pimeloyl-ACP methyl ester carboxylesterase
MLFAASEAIVRPRGEPRYYGCVHMKLLFRAACAVGAWSLTAAAASAAPCTAAAPGCTEWVQLRGGPSRSLVYRSHPLAVRNERIVRAFVMIHGQNRNADDYFRTAVAAAFLANALEDTVVVSPRFASSDGSSCRDKLSDNEVNWRCAGDSWRSGAAAIDNGQLTSYDFADELLRLLARKDVFPNLKAIVVAGHSAGGQFTARYGMANQVHEKLGVAVTYVVSNPSSYAWLDSTRPLESGAPSAFREGRNCTTYNQWPFGLEKRTGYAAQISDEALRKQLASRPVVYLLGELDTLPIAGFDSSCPAMAQGTSRLARGKAFAGHLMKKYGAAHKVTVVPLCGHNARCMFTSDAGLEVAFPNP